jgi:TonB family protein
MKTIRLVLLSICLAACATTGAPAEPIAKCARLTPFPEGVERPRSLHAPQPSPPRVGSISGYACVEVTIDTEGRVLDPQLLGTNNPEFAANLVRVVGDWRFEPATRDGTPVAVRYNLLSEYRRELMR